MEKKPHSQFVCEAGALQVKEAEADEVIISTRNPDVEPQVPYPRNDVQKDNMQISSYDYDQQLVATRDHETRGKYNLPDDSSEISPICKSKGRSSTQLHELVHQKLTPDLLRYSLLEEGKQYMVAYVSCLIRDADLTNDTGSNQTRGMEHVENFCNPPLCHHKEKKVDDIPDWEGISQDQQERQDQDIQNSWISKAACDEESAKEVMTVKKKARAPRDPAALFEVLLNSLLEENESTGILEAVIFADKGLDLQQLRSSSIVASGKIEIGSPKTLVFDTQQKQVSSAPLAGPVSNTLQPGKAQHSLQAIQTSSSVSNITTHVLHSTDSMGLISIDNKPAQSELHVQPPNASSTSEGTQAPLKGFSAGIGPASTDIDVQHPLAMPIPDELEQCNSNGLPCPQADQLGIALQDASLDGYKQDENAEGGSSPSAATNKLVHYPLPPTDKEPNDDNFTFSLATTKSVDTQNNVSAHPSSPATSRESKKLSELNLQTDIGLPNSTAIDESVIKQQTIQLDAAIDPIQGTTLQSDGHRGDEVAQGPSLSITSKEPSKSTSSHSGADPQYSSDTTESTLPTSQLDGRDNSTTRTSSNASVQREESIGDLPAISESVNEQQPIQPDAAIDPIQGTTQPDPSSWQSDGHEVTQGPSLSATNNPSPHSGTSPQYTPQSTLNNPLPCFQPDSDADGQDNTTTSNVIQSEDPSEFGNTNPQSSIQSSPAINESINRLQPIQLYTASHPNQDDSTTETSSNDSSDTETASSTPIDDGSVSLIATERLPPECWSVFVNAHPFESLLHFVENAECEVLTSHDKKSHATVCHALAGRCNLASCEVELLLRQLKAKGHESLFVEQNESGNTPMHIAVERRDPILIEVLLKCSTECLQVRNSHDDNPCQLAFNMKQWRILELFLHELIKADEIQANNPVLLMDLLHRAMEKGDTQFLSILLALQQQHNIEIGWNHVKNEATPWKLLLDQPLETVIEALQILSCYRVSLDELLVDVELGDTMLHRVARRGCRPLYQILVTQGASENQRNFKEVTPKELLVPDHTPLYPTAEIDDTAPESTDSSFCNNSEKSASFTSEAKKLDLTEQNNTRNSKIHDTILQTSWMQKMVSENYNVVLSFLQSSSQQLLMNKEGYTIVHAIVSSNFTIEQVSCLLDVLLQRNYGKLLTTQDRDGDTPLHIAVRLGRKEFISLLVSHSPDLLLIANHHSQTPLDVAVDERNADIITVLFEELIKAGIIVLHVDVTFETTEVDGVPVQTMNCKKLHLKVIAPEWGSAHLQHTCLQAIEMMEGWLLRLARQTFTTFRNNPATYILWNSTRQYPEYASTTESRSPSSSTLSSELDVSSTEQANDSYNADQSHTSEQDGDAPASRPTTSKYKRKRGTKLSYRKTAIVDETTTLKPVGVLYGEERWFSKLEICLERSGYSPSEESEGVDTHLTKPLKRRRDRSRLKRNRERARNRYEKKIERKRHNSDSESCSDICQRTGITPDDSDTPPCPPPSECEDIHDDSTSHFSTMFQMTVYVAGHLRPIVSCCSPSKFPEKFTSDQISSVMSSNVVLEDTHKLKCSCLLCLALQAQVFLPLVPHFTHSISELNMNNCLSDSGHLLYLPNRKKTEEGWVVIDKQALLSESDGTIFATENFQRHHFFPALAYIDHSTDARQTVSPGQLHHHLYIQCSKCVMKFLRILVFKLHFLLFSTVKTVPRYTILISELSVSNCLNEMRDNVLHMVVRISGEVENSVLKFLLRFDDSADKLMTEHNKRNHTPLMEAFQQSKLSALEWLVQEFVRSHGMHSLDTALPGVNQLLHHYSSTVVKDFNRDAAIITLLNSLSRCEQRDANNESSIAGITLAQFRMQQTIKDFRAHIVYTSESPDVTQNARGSEISIPPGENPIDRPDGRFRRVEIKVVQLASDASSSELVSTRTCSTPLESFCLPSNKEPRHHPVVLPRSTSRQWVQSDAPTSSSHFLARPVPTSTVSSPDHKPMLPEKRQDPYQEELKPYQTQLKVATDCLHAQDYVRMYQLLTISIPPWIPAQLRLAYKFGLGLGRFKMGKHKEAREHFKDCEMEALNEHQNGDVALCNIYLGDIEFVRQSFLPAAKHYSTAIDHYSSENAAQLFKMIIPTTAGLHIKLASALRNASKVADAVQIYKKAIATAESKKDKLSAHTSLGNLYQSLGENTSALAEYEESIKLSTELKDYVSLGWAHGNMGNAYLGLYQRDKALHQLEKSLELALKYEPTPQAIGRAYNNLGTAYQALNELDKAEDHYDLSLGQAIYGNDTAGQARVYGNIGNLLMLQKKFEKAIPHYTEVLRLSKDRSTVSTAFHNRGCAYYEWAETKKKAHFERESKSASSRNGTGHKRAFILFGPDFEDCEAEHQPPIIADSILKFYQQGSKDLQEVVKFHEETLQNIKGSSSGLSLSVSLFESNSRTFHRLQDSQVNLYHLQDSQVNLEQQWQKALLVAEQSRSRTLGELLLRKKGWQMRQPLSPPLPLEQIMDVVKAQKVPVVYFSYTGARLLMWALVPKSDSVSMGMCEVPLEDDQFEGKSLDYYLRYSLTEILVEKSFEMYNPFDYKSDLNNPVRDLYEVIGKPLRMLLKNLSSPDSNKQPQKIVIIPDSYTNLLPFTCLLDPETGTFLGDYYSFQIMPSLLAMGIMDQLPPTTVMIPASDQFSLCVVGNPTIPPFMYNGEYWNLGKLPHATKEAEWVAHTLRTKPILHEQATKSAVMMRMMSAKVIHITTHGSAAAGFLAFAGITPHKRSEETVNSSSVLVYPQDIENQNISPALVVLSSCDSGRGTVKADGIIGMARAFILAGAQAVLTTLWRVPDESAAIFMQFFYQYLVDGMSSSVALQKATLSLRCFSKYSQYIHWSGYQLTGRDVQFVVDSLDSTATKYSLGPGSVFPHLDAVKQLESAFITGPHIPTDVQILRGSPGTKPSEPLKDFIHSFHKHFKGGIFWLNGRKQELIQASIAYIESITGKPFSDIPISEANPALIVLDSIEHLPEFPNHQKVISFLKNPSVHIVIISNYYAPPDSLQKEIDRQLLRGSTVIDIKPLGMIHATQRLVHSVLSEHHLTPYNDDQNVFEKLAEFTSGSPVVGAVTSALLLSSMKCNLTTEEAKSPDSVLQEFAGSISLNELDPSSKPASSSLVNHDPLTGTAKTREISADVVRSITSISKAEDPWQTNSYYDLWQAISKLIEECKLIPKEQLLLYCLSLFSCSPIPMSLVTKISSIIARASHQPHLSSSLHSKLFEMCLLMCYPLPVVLGPQALELPKQARATGDPEFVYVPQCLSRAIWKDVMSYPDKVAALSTTYKALHVLKETTSDVVERRFLCGLVSLLLETYELNYKLMGKECYQEVYRLFLSLSARVVTPDSSRVNTDMRGEQNGKNSHQQEVTPPSGEHETNNSGVSSESDSQSSVYSTPPEGPESGGSSGTEHSKNRYSHQQEVTPPSGEHETNNSGVSSESDSQSSVYSTPPEGPESGGSSGTEHSKNRYSHQQEATPPSGEHKTNNSGISSESDSSSVYSTPPEGPESGGSSGTESSKNRYSHQQEVTPPSGEHKTNNSGTHSEPDSSLTCLESPSPYGSQTIKLLVLLPDWNPDLAVAIQVPKHRKTIGVFLDTIESHESIAAPVTKNITPLENVDDSQLEDDSHYDVISELFEVTRWYDLGLALGLKYRPTLETIKIENRERVSDCKRNMIQAWLEMQYDFSRMGRPSWRALVAALRSRPLAADCADIAEKMAQAHKIP